MCSYTGSSKNGVNGLISLRVFEFDYIYKTIPIPLTARGTARTVPVPYVEYGLVLYTIIVYTVLRFSPSVPDTDHCQCHTCLTQCRVWVKPRHESDELA